MQGVTPVIGDAFGLVEQVMQETVIPALLQGLGEVTPGIGVTRLPVKEMVLALPDPTNTAPENWTASCVIRGHLVALLRFQEEFRTADHSACLQEERTSVRKQNVLRAEDSLVNTLVGGAFQGSHQL